MDTLETTKTILGVISATVAIIGGSYTFLNDVGWNGEILTWAPEYFEIEGGPANGEFRAIVAREKHRDDCSVTAFKLEVKDSNHMIYPATPSVTKFSGPASDTIDKFGYKFYLHENDVDQIALGEATLLGVITYDCPEGTVYVLYPPNLFFEIEAPVEFHID